MSLLLNTLFTLIYLTNSFPSFSSELKSHLFREASHDSCGSPFPAPGSSLPLHFSPDACLVLVLPFWNVHFLTPGTCLSDSQRGMSSGSLHTDTQCAQWASGWALRLQLGGCVLPLPSHWDLHCSPLSLHGLWLPVDVDCGVSLGAISQLVEGVCLGDRQPFLHLPQPREFSHSGVDVSRCQWENWTYREFSGSSVSNLFWGKRE